MRFKRLKVKVDGINAPDTNAEALKLAGLNYADLHRILEERGTDATTINFKSADGLCNYDIHFERSPEPELKIRNHTSSREPVKIEDTEVWYKVTQIALKLGVTRKTVLNMIHRGELQALAFGSNWRISDQALNDYIARHSSGTRPEASHDSDQ